MAKRSGAYQEKPESPSLRVPRSEAETKIRTQIGKALDLVVHMEQLLDGTRKVAYITEVLESKDQDTALQDLFVFEQEKVDEQGRVVGRWHAKGVKPSFLGKLSKRNIKLSESLFEED